MRKFLTILIFIILFALVPAFVQNAIAEGPPPGPIDVPIDGGLGFLLATGVAYAAKKLHSHKKKQE